VTTSLEDRLPASSSASPASPDSLTVALVEDNPDHALLAAEALEERGHRVVHFQKPDEVVAACRTRRWDAMILDYVLPDHSGLELLQQIAELPDAPPVVMITASGSESVAVAALKKGASDYVVKTGRHGPELARAVELAVAKHRIEQMAALYQKELERQANTDALTGLLNRRRLADELSMAALRAAHSGEPYALVMIDIDNFKRINDSCGHSTGDAVLVEFASLLRKCFRDDDIIGRCGGDEFLVVIGGTTRSCRSRVRRRIRTAIADSHMLGRLDPPLLVSIGVADSCVGSSEEVLKAADRAMYTNKRRSRSA
jgi:diguanylate cyclase (GGDEF)-like protein